MAGRLQVDADLVRAAGEDADFEQGGLLAVLLQHTVFAERGVAALDDGAAGRVRRVGAERRVDVAAARLDDALAIAR